MNLRKTYEWSARGLFDLVNDLRRSLNVNEGGIRHADNVGPVIEFRYLTGQPYQLPARSVVCPSKIDIRCRNRTTGRFESNVPIDWEWMKGQVKINSITVSSSSDEYDVKLFLWVE